MSRISTVLALLGDDLAHKGSRVLTPIERGRSLSLVVKAPVLVAGGEGATTRSTTRLRRAHHGDEPPKTAGHLQHDTSAHGSHVSAGGSFTAIAT